MKQIFDYLLAFLLLVILLVPMLLLYVLASLSTRQNGIFVQQRVGQHGETFQIFKFRTLKGNYDNPVTTENTHLMTKVGRWMIRYKVDELPQLFNILNGTMSFVGPRPDVLGYADELKGDDRIVLKVKPGITGPAQLKYKNENEILKEVENPKKFNDEVLWPDKVEINKAYVENQSFITDLKLLWKTIF